MNVSLARMNVSFLEQLKSLTHVRCNLGNHKISLDDENRLFHADNNEIDAECSRCHVPLKLKKVPDDPRHFIGEEEDEEDN